MRFKVFPFKDTYFHFHLIQAVRKGGQKVSKKYELPPLAEFVKRKRGDITGDNVFLTSVSESQFKFCLINFIQLLSDFSAGQPSHLEFRLDPDLTIIPSLD